MQVLYIIFDIIDSVINFNLPEELIAQQPASPRDSARILVYDRKSKIITDSVFRDIGKYLNPNTTIVVNNSKVENCRWLFDNGKTEILVLEKIDNHRVRALVRPGRKFKLDKTNQINDFLSVTTTSIGEEGIRTLKLNIEHDDDRLKKFEHIPLPPYIEQNDDLADEYQTVYAKPLGSKAAPTAGLHFTDSLLADLQRSHRFAEVTLHVGLGTFAGLTEDNYKTGTLHAELYQIPELAREEIAESAHVTCVGTTATRTLESWANTGRTEGATDIFIQPGYKFKNTDSLITNFHLPGTSLLLMVEAFVGSESEMKRIYEHAIEEKYRFYSFGDAMLIL